MKLWYFVWNAFLCESSDPNVMLVESSAIAPPEPGNSFSFSSIFILSPFSFLLALSDFFNAVLDPEIIKQYEF